MRLKATFKDGHLFPENIPHLPITFDVLKSTLVHVGLVSFPDIILLVEVHEVTFGIFKF